MTEAERSLRMDLAERPGSVRVALNLWITAAALTAIIAVISLGAANGGSGSVEVSSVLLGALVLLTFGGWTIWQFGRGRPVARLALTGLTVFYLWSLLIDITVLTADDVKTVAAAPLLVIFEVIRVGCLVVAASLAYSTQARTYFAVYDAAAPRADVAVVPGWVWAVGIAVVAAQFAIGFIDNLPSHGRTWTEWATGRYAVSTALQTSALLCQVPAWAALVRQFRFGRQWARVTLILIGVLVACFEVLAIVDALDPDDPDDLASTFAMLGGAQLVTLAVAIAVSVLPAVNHHFRAVRDSGRAEHLRWQ